MYTNDNKILIFDRQGVSVVDVSTIIRIEAVGNYSMIYLAGRKKILASKVLKTFEDMLEGKGFIRIHRSHLVNSSCIQAYHLHELKIILHNKEQLCISRRKGRDVRKILYDQRNVYMNKQKISSAA